MIGAILGAAMDKTRRAYDGCLYTLREFIVHYGWDRGLVNWDEASPPTSEDLSKQAAGAGAEEPGAASAPATVAAPAPAGPTATATATRAEEPVAGIIGGDFNELHAEAEADAGVEEPGAASAPPTVAAPAPCRALPVPGIRPVLLPAGDIQLLCVEAKNQWRGYGELHELARKELNRITDALDDAGAAEPGKGVLDDAFPWRHYIAMHRQARELVGPGITEFKPTFIAGTRDSNRSGQPRLDFAIRHTDGGYWRIHPGNKPRDDAKPRYFPPEDGPERGADDQWRYLPFPGFTYAHAKKVPQTDRLGTRIAWAELESLPIGHLDSGPNATFKWWLWLANLGKISRNVLHIGVVGARLSFSQDNVKRVTCIRIDGSTIVVQLSLQRRGKIQTMIVND